VANALPWFAKHRANRESDRLTASKKAPSDGNRQCPSSRFCVGARFDFETEEISQ